MNKKGTSMTKQRISKLNSLIKKFTRLAGYYYNNKNNVKEYEQKCIEKFLDINCTTEELHYLAENHNFDDGVFLLENIINSPNCDVITARMIYWLSAPDYYYDEFGGAEFCDVEVNKNFADLIVKMETKAINEGYIESKKIVLSQEMTKFIDQAQLDYTNKRYSKIPECFRTTPRVDNKKVKQFLNLDETDKIRHIKELVGKFNWNEIIMLLENIGVDNLNSELLSNLSVAYNNKRDCKKAIATLEKIVEEDRDARWYYRIAYAYCFLDYPKITKNSMISLEFFEKSIEFNDKEVTKYCLQIVNSTNLKDIVEENGYKFTKLYDIQTKKRK